jgi:hypothetical protein
MVLALAIVNVDKNYARRVNPDEHFSRLRYRIGKYAQF